MILGIIGGLVYNGVRSWWVPGLMDLPEYLSQYFDYMGQTVSVLGVVSIGVFTTHQVRQTCRCARKKQTEDVENYDSAPEK